MRMCVSILVVRCDDSLVVLKGWCRTRQSHCMAMSERVVSSHHMFDLRCADDRARNPCSLKNKVNQTMKRCFASDNRAVTTNFSAAPSSAPLVDVVCVSTDPARSAACRLADSRVCPCKCVAHRVRMAICQSLLVHENCHSA